MLVRKTMKDKLTILFAILIALFVYQQESFAAGEESVSVQSPDGSVEVDLSLSENGTPHYKVVFNGETIVKPSSLGFEFKNQESLGNHLKIVKTDIKEFNKTWEPVWGEKSKIKNHYKQQTVYLKETKAPYRKMNLVFRVYNDGIGFRYVIPEQENVNPDLQITSENTEFHFANDNTSWWIPNDWDSYEYNYNQTLLSEVEEVSTPFTMKTPQGIHLSVHEAALIDYSGMALKKAEGESTKLVSHLAPWPDSNVKVKKDSLPVETPWRTIQIGEDAGDLVESDLILNLNEPNTIDNTEWIEPMKYVGVWWEMISGKSTWASGPDHGATTENAKRYIDFASEYLDTENQNIGLLVEGWNKGWDGNWMENGDLFSFTESYPDYDLEEVVQYAQERGVSYIMHNETSGDILNYESQMDEAYDYYQQQGIHAIKSGYVADYGIHNPPGQHHHGQYMVNHYLDTIKKAAEHEIMINSHEPIKGTGLYRTYPNWVSREGVSGMEYSAFSDDTNPPEHETILPFTRMMSGPVDFTPGIFDVNISHADTRVHSTRAKQLALYVVLTSGTQMVADFPENYKDENGEILPEFKFMRDVPVTWDDIMVPHAEIGDYASIVRRSGEEWYIGSVTDEKDRDLEIELDFLEKGTKYVAEIYSDGTDANLETNPTSVSIKKVIVKENDTLIASLEGGGGQAVRLYPASKEEIAKLSNYKEGKMKVSYVDIPKSIQSNDDLAVKVNVENRGSVISGKTLNLQIEGETVAEKHVRVAPGEQKEVVLTYDKLFDPRTYRIHVSDLPAKKIIVTEKEPTFEYSNLEASVDQGEIHATASVTNYGSYAGEVEVPLTIDGEVVDTKRIEVSAEAGGATEEIGFTYDPKAETGLYKVSIGDLKPKAVALPQIELAGEWLFKQGDDLAWKEPDLDDSSWQAVQLPSKWEDHSNLYEDYVYGWYRKSIYIPEEWEGYSLKMKLGRIDDVDATYFNGEKIGQSGTFPTGEGEEGMISAWDWDREYVIPSEKINYGAENVISIRVFDARWDGGLYTGPLGPLELVEE
ncbi:hypothetical protein GCM10008986_14720 [Salinibacillus aidingensis]|uniref:Alpha-glucosidase n=2 Tax=Salinibacillus aidingensis TaxID=237684 RepID=A0ABN1B4Q6_9BACI